MDTKEIIAKLKTFDEFKEDTKNKKPELCTIFQIAQKTIGFELAGLEIPKPKMKNVEVIEKAFIVVLDDTNLREYGYSEDEWLYTNSYLGTEKAILNKEPKIITTSLAHISFDLLELGYELYVFTWNAKMVKFYPGMDNSHNKDIRFAHNIRKLIIGGAFDEDLKIDRNNL